MRFFNPLTIEAMNNKFRITILTVLLPALFLLLSFQGCKKSSETPDPVQPDAALVLKGKVIHATTHAGIANATVYLAGQTLVTDAAGWYTCNCKTIASGDYDVRVTANGYGYGFASATIDNNAAVVNTIVLKPLAEATVVGSAGGIVTIIDPESLFTGNVNYLMIPAGAFSSNVNVSFTRFAGVDVPGYAPASLLNLCTVNLAPEGTIAAQPVELRFPLPFNGAEINSLPLLRYDFATNTWNNTGLNAQISGSENYAIVQVTEFGTYSLGVSGSYVETSGTSGPVNTLELSTSQSMVDFHFLASSAFQSVPFTISPVYLKNLASQNTRIHGARVSFSDSTTYLFNYIGSKPDSLAPVKSTLTGYYRWVPKVSYSTREMPVTITLRDVAVIGTITKETYTDACGWLYVHDQGGGGK